MTSIADPEEWAPLREVSGAPASVSDGAEQRGRRCLSAAYIVGGCGGGSGEAPWDAIAAALKTAPEPGRRYYGPRDFGEK